MKMNQGNFSENRFKIDREILEFFKAGLSTESQTIIRCKINACEILQYGGWVNISPNTYLINRQSNEKLKLIYIENILHAPHRYFFAIGKRP